MRGCRWQGLLLEGGPRQAPAGDRPPAAWYDPFLECLDPFTNLKVAAKLEGDGKYEFGKGGGTVRRPRAGATRHGLECLPKGTRCAD